MDRRELIGEPLVSHCVYYCSEFHNKGSWRSLDKTTLLLEKMCHYLELPIWWFGREVVDVFSMRVPNIINYYNHPDNHQVSYRYAGGAVSQMNFTAGMAATGHGDPLLDTLDNKLADGHALRFTIGGTKGWIETDVFKRRIRRWAYSDSPERHVSTLVEAISFPAENAEFPRVIEFDLAHECMGGAAGSLIRIPSISNAALIILQRKVRSARPNA